MYAEWACIFVLNLSLQNHSYNYTSYFARGGKLLHYAGLADQIISSGNSVSNHIGGRDVTLILTCFQYELYNSVSAFTKANTNLDPFDSYRFFPIPGKPRPMTVDSRC